MTSKFRRNNTDKKLNLLQKEHDAILSEISAIEDGTDNNSIMDIINPVFKDLNMNNNNIINVDNMFMKDNLVLESVGVGSCNITMTNDIKQTNSRISSTNTQLTIETIDDNRLVLKAQDMNYVVIDPDNTLYPDSITLLSTVKIDGDIKTNNIFNTGDIQTSTVNGGTILTNPLSSALDCNGGDIKNVNDISAITLNSDVINVNYIRTNTTNSIDINAFLGNIDLTSIKTNSHSDIDMKNNELLNVSKITSNTTKVGVIDGINPNIGIIKNLDMATRQILNCSRINRSNGSLIIDGQEVIIDNLSTIGNANSTVTYMSDVDMNQYNISNVGTLEVSDIKDHVIYKNLIAGNEIKYSGRVNVKAVTTTTTPVLLFRIQYTHNCSVYEGRLFSSNYNQGKIWTSPAVVVVNDAMIDKNIGGSGIASIGGTTRASTIDFVINSGYLEGYVTANFTDETVSIFDFSVWSDLY